MVHSTPSASRWARSAVQIERTWLGYASPPLSVRLEEGGWAPELPDQACARCGATTGPGTSVGTGCGECRDQKLPWERFVRLGVYEGVLGEIVREVKFNRFRALGLGAGRLLGVQLALALSEAHVDPNRVWVVPVPMSRRRYLQRGIDHTLCIARGVVGASGTRLVRCLIRSHGPTQLAIVPSRRQENVSGRFRVRRGIDRKNLPHLIVVLDDVRTSGATLASACRAVRKSLPVRGVAQEDRVCIWAMAMAVTDTAERKVPRS